MDSELLALTITAATIGFVHTVLGPDHYLPFIAMAKARSWSLQKTVAVTSICGVGHVLGSVTLGLLGIALGWAVAGMERFESVRGDVAGWLLLGFGLAYLAWALRQMFRKRPHRHWHHHADGTVHEHLHQHRGGHSHVHQLEKRSVTPWVLFVIFVFGPCEALIPVLMVPAARGSWGGLVLVTSVFAAATIGTMLAIVLAGVRGLSQLRWAHLERYAHVMAGLTLVACGLAIQFGL